MCSQKITLITAKETIKSRSVQCQINKIEPPWTGTGRTVRTRHSRKPKRPGLLHEAQTHNPNTITFHLGRLLTGTAVVKLVTTTRQPCFVECGTTLCTVKGNCEAFRRLFFLTVLQWGKVKQPTTLFLKRTHQATLIDTHSCQTKRVRAPRSRDLTTICRPNATQLPSTLPLHLISLRGIDVVAVKSKHI